MNIGSQETTQLPRNQCYVFFPKHWRAAYLLVYSRILSKNPVKRNVLSKFLEWLPIGGCKSACLATLINLSSHQLTNNNYYVYLESGNWDTEVSPWPKATQLKSGRIRMQIRTSWCQNASSTHSWRFPHSHLHPPPDPPSTPTPISPTPTPTPPLGVLLPLNALTLPVLGQDPSFLPIALLLHDFSDAT